jgi:SAM-dependent methyltransferase
MAGYRTYMRARCRYLDAREEREPAEAPFPNVPPPSLRYRVHTDPSLNTFLEFGRKHIDILREAAARAELDMVSCERILDFGCGCGRTLLWLPQAAPRAELFGTDVDPDSVGWCGRHLPFARCSVNDSLPPLAFPDEHFDLAYAISVFSHLDEERQFAWLQELRRVTRPGGVVLLSVLGEEPRQRSPWVKDEPESGYTFVKYDLWKGLCPPWYQVAYHSREYVYEQYAKHFEVVDFVPAGMTGQDLVVLRSPARVGAL